MAQLWMDIYVLLRSIGRIALADSLAVDTLLVTVERHSARERRGQQIQHNTQRHDNASVVGIKNTFAMRARLFAAVRSVSVEALPTCGGVTRRKLPG